MTKDLPKTWTFIPNMWTHVAFSMFYKIFEMKKDASSMGYGFMNKRKVFKNYMNENIGVSTKDTLPATIVVCMLIRANLQFEILANTNQFGEILSSSLGWKSLGFFVCGYYVVFEKFIV